MKTINELIEKYKERLTRARTQYRDRILKEIIADLEQLKAEQKPSESVQEYYESLDRGINFTELTGTGITSNLNAVFEFTKKYFESQQEHTKEQPKVIEMFINNILLNEITF